MKSDCRKFSEDLTALALNELSGESLEAVNRHLRKCAACRETLEDVRRLFEAADDLPRLRVSSGHHERMMESIRMEEAAERLSLPERVRMAGGFIAYRLGRSGTARFLLIAAAAQILVAFALYLAFDLRVQNTSIERPSAFEPTERKEFPLPSGEEPDKLIFPEDETAARHGTSKELEPPTPEATRPRLSEPGFVEGSALVAEIPTEYLSRRIERENRLELSRYRMCARLSVRCKSRILEGRGGGTKTEYAVERGIKWLKAHQEEDGSWSPGGVSGGDDRTRVGVTALAVAALLSDGHSQIRGRYRQTVSDGIHFIIANRDREGRFGWVEGEHGLSLFNHSTAVLTLAENYILSEGLNEETLLEGVESLIRLMERNARDEDGPSLDAFSRTWAAMALRTSVMTGLEVQDLRKAASEAEQSVALLAHNERRTGMAAAMDQPPLYTASEIALDSLFHEEERAVAGPDELPLPDRNDPGTLFTLLDDPDFREPSFLFFIGTALCEEGGDLWQEWNRRVKFILLDEQQTNGLWLVEGDWPWIDGGDIYTTSLHLLALQVYYRYIKLEELCN